MGKLSKRNKNICGQTVLQLSMEGAEGATSINDDSLSKHSIAFNGDADIIQSATDPFGRSTGILDLDGTGDYVRVPQHEDFDFKDLDWTIEFWDWQTAAIHNQYVLFNGYAGGAGCYIFHNTTIGYWNVNVQWTVGNTTVSGGTRLNSTWQHIALCRGGDTLYLFVDGVLVDSDNTIAGKIMAAPIGPLDIGADNGTFGNNGRFSNFRIIKGHALYTKNFSVPTNPFPKCFKPSDISSLVCWLDANKLAQADGSAVATWSDRTTNGNDFTQGTGSVQPSFQTNESNGRSVIRFDQSGDKVEASSKVIPVGAKTVIMVFKKTTMTDSSGVLISENNINYTVEDGFYIEYLDSTDKLQIATSQSSLTLVNIAGATPPQGLDENTYHLVYYTWDGTTDGGKNRYFINGILEDLDTAANTEAGPGSYNTAIGTRNTTTAQIRFGGDIAEVLIFNAELPLQDKNRLDRYLNYKYDLSLNAPTKLCITDAGTPNQVLLLHSEGPNGESDILDSSPNDYSVGTNNGSVAHDTSSKPFGFSSLSFTAASSQYLRYDDNSNWDIDDSDYTIEAWVKPNSTHTGIIVGHYAGGTNRAWLLSFLSDGSIQAIIYDDPSPLTGVSVTTATSFYTTGEWIHVAQVHNNGSLYLYVNGKEIGNVSTSGTYSASSGLYIGARPNEGEGGSKVSFLDGEIKELRIVKGTAVYTSNFKPKKNFFCDQ
jgi:hypothetical protein